MNYHRGFHGRFVVQFVPLCFAAGLRPENEQPTLGIGPLSSASGFTGMPSVYSRARHPSEPASLRFLRRTNPTVNETDALQHPEFEIES